MSFRSGTSSDSLTRFLVLAATAISLTASSANAVPLDELLGTTRTAGPLSFEFTDVEEIGGVPLSAIELIFVTDGGFLAGFDFIAPAGAFRVENGGLADIKLSFTLTSSVPIVGVTNALTGSSISGEYSLTSISESLSELIDDIGVGETAGGALLFASMAVPGLTSIDITKDLLIKGNVPGFAELAAFEQRYEFVPEPSTAGLLALGLIAMAQMHRGASRCRRSSQCSP